MRPISHELRASRASKSWTKMTLSSLISWWVQALSYSSRKLTNALVICITHLTGWDKFLLAKQCSQSFRRASPPGGGQGWWRPGGGEAEHMDIKNFQERKAPSIRMLLKGEFNSIKNHFMSNYYIIRINYTYLQRSSEFRLKNFIHSKYNTMQYPDNMIKNSRSNVNTLCDDWMVQWLMVNTT